MSDRAHILSPLHIRTRLFMGAVPADTAATASRRADLLANLIFASAVMLAVLAMSARLAPAAAQDLNAIIGDSETAQTTAETTIPDQPGASTSADQTGSLQPASGQTAPVTKSSPQTDATTMRGEKVWVKHASSMAHLDVIAARPLTEQTCRNVIFDAAVPVKTRLSVAATETLAVPLADLCMISLRNNSADRALVVRMADAFETLSIVPHPQLFTGMELAPGQQITVPIRPLKVSELAVGVETVWKADLNTADPKVDSAVLSFTGP